MEIIIFFLNFNAVKCFRLKNDEFYVRYDTVRDDFFATIVVVSSGDFSGQ